MSRSYVWPLPYPGAMRLASPDSPSKAGHECASHALFAMWCRAAQFCAISFPAQISTLRNALGFRLSIAHRICNYIHHQFPPPLPILTRLEHSHPSRRDAHRMNLRYATIVNLSTEAKPIGAEQAS